MLVSRLHEILTCSFQCYALILEANLYSIMSTTSENNKRIARNTMFLYFRQILVMAVSLYTVRVVLDVLGEEDYGIYNVVGGFVAMFNILSGALSVAISRFITYEMGQPDVTTLGLRSIFSSSLLIQIAMGLVIAMLLGTFGVWFVEYKMVIPAERLDVALYVLGFSTLNFFINLLSVPYNALIIAHEQMKAFAYISVVEVTLKLVVAYLLVISPLDKLWLYALSMALVSLVVRFIYAAYCKRHFAECCFVWGFDRRLLYKMFVFSGWAFLGNGSFVLKEHGVNILLNIFCGPIVNAARGITSQVTGAITLFVSNFMQAVNPQITKLYSSGNLQDMHRLIFKSSRFSFYLMLMLGVPLMKGIDYILSFWLVSVPEYTAVFIQLLMVFCLMDCLVQPLMTGLLAEGNIRVYEIALVVLNIGNVFFSYIALKHGYFPECVYWISIVVEVGIIISRVWLSGKTYQLPVKRYCVEVLGNALLVAAVTGIFAWWICLPLNNAFANFILSMLLVFLFAGLMVYVLGLTRNERKFLRTTIKNKLCL